MQPVLDGLENHLDDSLSLTLELAKSEQDKANKYTEELLAYTRRFKGHAPHFNEIATALAAKAVAQLPGPLQEIGNAMLPIIKKHGVPEKAYAKFADKLHFLMSALSAAASTQLVKNAYSMDRGTAPPAVKSVEMTPKAAGTYDVVSTSEVVTTVDGVAVPEEAPMIPSAPPAIATATATSEAMLKKILEDNIEESDEPFRAILIGTRTVPYTFVFGLWVDRKPHLMTVTFFGMIPASMRITAAPSNDFILQLQSNPSRVRKELSAVRKECKAVPGAIDKRKNHDVVFMGLFPYVGLLCNMSVVYCNCLWTRLTLSDFSVNGKAYTVKVVNKAVFINDVQVFEPSNIPCDCMGLVCSCCCSGPMISEMCC
jgi:hypothetical protein